jgi:hypothetical protein
MSVYRVTSGRVQQGTGTPFARKVERNGNACSYGSESGQSHTPPAQLHTTHTRVSNCQSQCTLVRCFERNHRKHLRCGFVLNRTTMHESQCATAPLHETYSIRLRQRFVVPHRSSYGAGTLCCSLFHPVAHAPYRWSGLYLFPVWCWDTVVCTELFQRVWTRLCLRIFPLVSFHPYSLRARACR